MTKAFPDEMPDVMFDYPEDFPKAAVEHFLDGFDKSGPNVHVRAQEPQVWASAELIIPGLIVAMITRSYFEGYLKEAGKDHYQITKKWLGALARKCHSFSKTVFAVASSDLKAAPNSPYSKGFSVFYLTKPGNRVKLVYNNDMSADQWEQLTQEFAEIMQKHYEEYPNDPLSKALLGLPSHEILLAVMDPEEGWKLGTWKTFLPKNIKDKLAEGA